MAFVAFEFICIALYYFCYYRKQQLEGKPLIHIKKLIWIALFIGYIALVLNLTIISRGSSHYKEMNLHLFSGYVEAWNSYSYKKLQPSIYNILMFIPMGMLLPLLSRKLTTFKWLIVVVVCFTLFIEIYQLVTGAGIFELDDLFNNTLGGVIGYQFYRLYTSVIQHKKVRMKSLLGSLVIPLLMVFIFAGITIAYAKQEFGNLSINSYSKWDMTDVHLTTSMQLNSVPTMASVYKKVNHSDEVGDILYRKLGLTEVKTAAKERDRGILLEDKSGSQYTLFQSTQGNWTLTDSNYTPQQATWTKQGPMRLEAMAIMDNLAILPQKADLITEEGDQFQWSLSDTPHINKDYWSGDLSLGLKKDGSIYAVSYGLQEHHFIREVDILTPKDVYERIKKGEFPLIKRNAILTPDMMVIKKGDKLEITGMELTFMYDTKEFYQPVYRVSGIFNGDSDWFTLIQARRN
ncbi:glycopeptide antibiotics resistance protein [Lysinibacillus parviboronicapiens]|uniref:Glycopeptide antibiotics resistance protein n=1 Tax=Lysinibacillus parviboronicapiens TaxID=436516 RepID=A0ABV2PFC2_9BACI